MRWFCTAVVAVALFAAQAGHWRAATETELRAALPARAPVESERIETEFRTASGITDERGLRVAGVVLITAGYSAEGKYSHYLVTQVPLRIGEFSLTPGEYVFGSQHEGDGLTVKFYRASDGHPLGSVRAERQSRLGRIESFHLYPPAGPKVRGIISVGRFGFAYEVSR